MIPAEFSDKQLAGLIKRFAGNVCFHAKRCIHVRTHHKCFSFAFIFFAMFQSMNMTSFEKIGARAMKNELKWRVSLFSGHPVFPPEAQHLPGVGVDAGASKPLAVTSAGGLGSFGVGR